MSTQVVPESFKINAGTAGQLALGVNSNRKFLQIINRSAAVITFKFDTPFGQAQSQVQHIGFSAVPTYGTYQLAYGAYATGDLNFDTPAATIQAALQALVGIGSGNVMVTGNYSTGFTFTFLNALANVAVSTLVVQHSTLLDQSIQQSATQNINWSTPPQAGTFRVNFVGQETPDLAFSESAAALMTALNLLSTINGAVSSVVQDPVSKNFSIAFGNAPLYHEPLALLTITHNSLTNSDGIATGVQSIYFVPETLQGTYRIEAGAGAGNVTADLPFDTVAADLQAALEGLTAIGSGNITVAGDYLVGFTCTFAGALVDTVVPTLWVIGSTMHPDVLEEPQKRVPDDIETITVIDTPGHGVDNVTASVVTLVPGIAPAAVTTTSAITTTGQPTPTEGEQLAAQPVGQQLYDVAVPIGQLYVKASADNSPVEIFEG